MAWLEQRHARPHIACRACISAIERGHDVAGVAPPVPRNPRLEGNRNLATAVRVRTVKLHCAQGWALIYGGDAAIVFAGKGDGRRMASLGKWRGWITGARV